MASAVVISMVVVILSVGSGVVRGRVVAGPWSTCCVVVAGAGLLVRGEL